MTNFNLVRKNSDNIKSITDFEYFKCDNENNVFVRIIGENDSLLNDISNMDNHLRNRTAYIRISKLKMVSPETVSYYNDAYVKWLRSFKKKAEIKCTQNNEELSLSLGTALAETFDVFKKTRPVIPPSIEKNFIIKLLFWYDEFIGDLIGNGYMENGLKVVGENISRIHDYLFFYMVIASGGSVLLIQNKTDLIPEAKNLNLSSGYVLGHLGNTDIPEYVRIFTSSQRTSNGGSFVSPHMTSYGNDARQNPSVRVTIPKRYDRQPVRNDLNRSSYESGVSQQNEIPPIKVKIPPRPEKRLPHPSYGTGAQQQSGSGSVRVTIPPHPNRKTTIQQRQTVYGSGYSSDSQQGQYSRNLDVPRSVDNYGRTQTNTGTGITIPAPNSGNLRMPYGDPYAANQGPVHSQGFQGNGYRDGQTRIPGMASNRPKREKTFEELAQLASSVVQIFVMHRNQYQMNGKDMEIESLGSGVMIGENGYIVTNFHVVEGGQVFGVRIENDDRIYFTEQLIKYHRDFDLAVLRIDRKLRPLPVYNDPKGLVRGQKVVAIGSPHGLFNTVSDGIISGFRNVDGVDMIQFTAPVSPGSSGGAVLNMYGEVIGISRMIRNDAQNINLAVGYDLILNFCRSFI